jgi:hypothetical protein
MTATAMAKKAKRNNKAIGPTIQIFSEIMYRRMQK